MSEDTKVFDETESSSSNNTVRVVSTQKGTTYQEYSVYLNNDIDSNRLDYYDFLEILRKAGPNDKINIYLNSYGGCCHTGFMIADHIRRCKAKVTNIVSSPNYSMGSILALTGQELQMAPGTMLMFHNYSGNFGGKGSETAQRLEEWAKYFRKTLELYCTPFLTAAEIDCLVSDQDVYVHETDPSFKARMKRHFKIKK